jgi:HK97 family phage major capsid protein
MEENMDELETKTMIAEAAAAAASEAVKQFIAALPEVKAGFAVDVTEDEADRALKGNPFQPGEYFKAVKNAALAPHSVDQRLMPLKAALGNNEAIPSQGGFLVPLDIESGIRDKMWGVGSLLARFTEVPVTGNGMTVNLVDETSRAAGYRMGGVRGYWLAEAATKTASYPTFKQAELKLKKVAALCYASDEMLDDAAFLGSWLSNNVPTELRFMVEDAIINGTGAGTPLGILNSPALVSAVRTDGSEVDNLDIGRMWAARYPGVNDYIWLINQNVMPQLMNMTIGQMPAYMPPGGLSGASYGSLLGRPVVETEYNPSLGTLGDIMLISPSKYILIGKGGIQTASSIHVQFITDQTAYRFVYRVDGQPEWASSVARYKPSTDSVSPYVALAAAT